MLSKITNKLSGVSVLVTGGSGFIGSHLARRLVKEKAKVTLLIREKTDLKNIQDIKSKVNLVKGDLTDYLKLVEIVKKVNPQKIFHLAAYINRSRSLERIENCMKINFSGTVNLVRALENVNYDCFINTGTCEEYGNIVAPFKEDQLVNPVSPYSLSKSASILFCDMYHKNTGRPIISIRPFTTYGPAQHSRMLVSQIILSAIKREDFNMSLGEQYREFNYVSDIVDGFIKASLCKKAIGEVINLGTGVEYTVAEVAKKIISLMDNPIKVHLGAIPYRENEIWHLYCDNTKARKLLKWKPRVSLEDGLKQTIKWTLENYKDFYK